MSKQMGRYAAPFRRTPGERIFKSSPRARGRQQRVDIRSLGPLDQHADVVSMQGTKGLPGAMPLDPIRGSFKDRADDKGRIHDCSGRQPQALCCDGRAHDAVARHVEADTHDISVTGRGYNVRPRQPWGCEEITAEDNVRLLHRSRRREVQSECRQQDKKREFRERCERARRFIEKYNKDSCQSGGQQHSRERQGKKSQPTNHCGGGHRVAFDDVHVVVVRTGHRWL